MQHFVISHFVTRFIHCPAKLGIPTKEKVEEKIQMQPSAKKTIWLSFDWSTVPQINLGLIDVMKKDRL